MNISQPKMRSTVLSGPALVTPFFVLQILAMSDYTVEEDSIGCCSWC